LQKRRQANIVFREIWGAVQFSTFSTASANTGLMRRSETSTLSNQQSVGHRLMNGLADEQSDNANSPPE
jgi:hypothetical protein